MGPFAAGASSLFKGVLLGFLVVTFFVAVLIVISVVARADNPDIYQHPSAEVIALQDALSDLQLVVIESAAALETPDCERANEWLDYMLAYIYRSIARNPETAYIFADTLKAIEESRCEE